MAPLPPWAQKTVWPLAYVLVALVLIFVTNIVTVAMGLPWYLQPYGMGAAVCTRIVHGAEWLGGVCGQGYVWVATKLTLLLERLRPALRQTLEDLGTITASPIRIVSEFFSGLWQTVVNATYTVAVSEAGQTIAYYASGFLVKPVHLLVTTILTVLLGITWRWDFVAKCKEQWRVMNDESVARAVANQARLLAEADARQAARVVDEPVVDGARGVAVRASTRRIA